MLIAISTRVLAAPVATNLDLDASIQHVHFKGSHNSYSLPDPLDVQIDGANVWKVELDLMTYTESDGIGIGHPPDLVGGCPTHAINDYLNLIDGSQAATDRVTFIYLEHKNCHPACWVHTIPPECSEASDSELVTKAGTALRSVIARSRFYTKSDWDSDGHEWPSINELLSRGKHFIPIYEDGATGADDGAFFFTVAANAEQLSAHPNKTVLNVPAGELGDFGFDPETPGKEKYLWRSYCVPTEPVIGTITDCELHRQEYWMADLAHGINILSINDVWDSHTFDDVVQPHPFYVGPLANASRSLGTRLFPFDSARLSDALARVATHGRAVFSPLVHYPGAASFDRPFAIESRPAGTLVLGAP